MALPDPLPDDPRKWDGWRLYSSTDCYERLGLSIHENPSREIIEESCRRLLIWWQKKLPLKNQPSNPLAQLLRSGLDEAPMFLTEARAILLDPQTRAEHDEVLLVQFREAVVGEFKKYLEFALSDRVLKADDEVRLEEYGRQHGLSDDIMASLIAEALERTGSSRFEQEPVPESTVPNRPNTQPSDPTQEFKRMLSLTGLGPDDMTDDQRDALVNMAENLGLDAGDAEDLIDEFLDEVEEAQAPAPNKALPLSPAQKIASGILPNAGGMKTNRTGPGQRLTNRMAPRVTTRIQRSTDRIHIPQQQIPDSNPKAEFAQFPPFTNTVGIQMLLVPTGQFQMGSVAEGASPNEHPVTRVHVSRFYLSRHPVTNAQFEAFDPSHQNKRLGSAGDDHPVVHVSSTDAIKFCQWLSARERKRYRLPTEAEWEYAARGTGNRTYPWGDQPTPLANFADRNTNFAWSDPAVDDGFAETSPVGAFPSGASPFGIEDMAGNVWEWCLDFFENYKGGERINPRGPATGVRRVYRGGSWRSRFQSLRASARSSNIPNFSCNDVGFRVVCEVD